MGNQKSSPVLLKRDTWSQVMSDMESKYGYESLSCLSEWFNMGFPEKGSLDLKELLELGSKLKKAERKMMAKREIKTKCVANCTHHMKVFEMWKYEAENRQRKLDFNELPKINENESPPLYNARTDCSPMSMCVPQRLSCLDLGANPPPPCPPPPTSKQQQRHPSKASDHPPLSAHQVQQPRGSHQSLATQQQQQNQHPAVSTGESYQPPPQATFREGLHPLPMTTSYTAFTSYQPQPQAASSENRGLPHGQGGAVTSSQVPMQHDH